MRNWNSISNILEKIIYHLSMRPSTKVVNMGEIRQHSSKHNIAVLTFSPILTYCGDWFRLFLWRKAILSLNFSFGIGLSWSRFGTFFCFSFGFSFCIFIYCWNFICILKIYVLGNIMYIHKKIICWLILHQILVMLCISTNFIVSFEWNRKYRYCN